MTAVDFAIFGAVTLGSLLFLFAGTFFLLLCERLVHARVQHRDGPGRHGQIDFFQVWKDFLKIRAKGRGNASPLPLRIRLATLCWGILPAVFLLTLLAAGYLEAGREIDLPLLLLLPIFGVALESLLMHATADTQERFDRRRRLWLRSLGVTSLLLSVFAVGLRVGELNLGAISDLQIYFPYHAALSSPGLLLCAAAAFCAIFLLATDSPVQLEEEQSLNHSLQYAVVFVQKMWVFALLCFWVYVFGGGAKGPVVKALFPLKVAAATLAFSVLQASFPKIRSADAGELAARWLLPLCLIGFFLEAVWVGVRG